MKTKFNFLDARTKQKPNVTVKETTFRRSGIGKIVTEVQLAHPNWPQQRIEAQAKALWAQRNPILRPSSSRDTK